jgi:3-mercaptopropionate dioxygenase
MTPSAPYPKGPFADLLELIRAAIRDGDDWAETANRVMAALDGRLPAVAELPGVEPTAAKALESRVLHTERDGSFSVVALVCPPDAATVIHDHVTWCVFAVLAGVPAEERFVLDETATALEPAGRDFCQPGTLTGGAPPGDVHRLSNPGPLTAVSLHVYGTDVSRIGSSVRRTYDLPIVAPSKELA